MHNMEITHEGLMDMIAYTKLVIRDKLVVRDAVLVTQGFQVDISKEFHERLQKGGKLIK